VGEGAETTAGERPAATAVEAGPCVTVGAAAERGEERLKTEVTRGDFSAPCDPSLSAIDTAWLAVGSDLLADAAIADDGNAAWRARFAAGSAGGSAGAEDALGAAAAAAEGGAVRFNAAGATDAARAVGDGPAGLAAELGGRTPRRRPKVMGTHSSYFLFEWS
jgi:hypothetical protein